MIKATGGKGKVAILLGASGNNVTTDRTKGFVDEIAGQRAGHRDRRRSRPASSPASKGQQVMEQLIQSKPDITAVYAENDEMGARRGHRAEGRRQGAGQGRQDRVDRRHAQRRAADRRRQLQRRRRVQPALRSARVRDARRSSGTGRRDRRRPCDHRQRIVRHGRTPRREARRTPTDAGHASVLAGDIGTARRFARRSRRSRDVDLHAAARARSTRWSARTAPASPR